jgi:hypothetical protein
MNTTTKGITAIAVSFTLALFTGLSTASADETIEPSTMAKVTRSLNPVNWKLPKWKMPKFTRLLPGGEKKAPVKEKKNRDGLINGVTKTASSSWNKTKQAFDAKKLNPINYLPVSAKSAAKEKQEKSKPGFFRSLFRSKDTEPPMAATPADFLRLDRPGL